MKRKYSLVGTKNCKSKNLCIAMIANVSEISIKEATQNFSDGEIYADPDHPEYRNMIDVLDANDVEVYDYERVQLPKREEVSNEKPSYT